MPDAGPEGALGKGGGHAARRAWRLFWLRLLQDAGLPAALQRTHAGADQKGGALMIARLALASCCLLLLAAQADSAPEPLKPNIEAICTELVKDRAHLMDQCRAEEELAFIAVLSWLEQNGLLGPDGAIDTLALLEGQLDPLLAEIGRASCRERV